MRYAGFHTCMTAATCTRRLLGSTRRIVFVRPRGFFTHPARADRFAARPARFASSPEISPDRPISPLPTIFKFIYFGFRATQTHAAATTRSSLILTIQWDQKREPVINIASIYIYNNNIYLRVYIYMCHAARL